MRYFNCNAVIGKNWQNAGDFSNAAELIKHMDSLGVDRSLVYHEYAQSGSTMGGNRELMEQIAPYSDRLFPIFCLTPPDFYRTGRMEYMRSVAASGKVRAFRISNAIRPKRFEALIETLAEFKPLFMFDSIRAKGDYTDDFIYLGERYPQVSFVVTRQMWVGMNTAFDAMRAVPNFYVDTSILHINHVLELIRDEFGIERLLYGFNFAATCGASQGALAQADFTPEEKELVAHGNLERLLGIPALEKPLAPEPDLSRKPLWKTFREGKKLEGVEIWDAHSHWGSNTRPDGWIIRGHDDQEGMLGDIVGVLDKLGMTKSCLIPGLRGKPLELTRELEQRAKAFPGRLYGYVPYNPFYAELWTEEVLDDLFSRDFFIGFKTLCSYWQIRLDDPRFEPLWQYADRYHLAVLGHNWGDNWNSPSMLKDTVKRYPNAQFLLGHSGGNLRGRMEAEELAESSPNVHLEVCASFCCERSLCKSIERLGIERFVFGSDTYCHNVAYELASFLSLPLPDAELLPALAENMKKVVAAIRRPLPPGGKNR